MVIDFRFIFGYCRVVDRLSFRNGELRSFIEQVQDVIGVETDKLGILLGLSGRTIRDWKREKFKPSKDYILKMSQLSGIKLPEYKILPAYWSNPKSAKLAGKRTYQLYGLLGTKESRSKGGEISWLKRKNDPDLWNKYTNPITKPVESEDLAEFIGIMLGDGGLTHFQCSIYLNSDTDREFADYVKDLINRLFKIVPKIYKHKKEKVLRVSVSGVNLIEYLTSKGLSLGNKVHLQAGVPSWIKSKSEYINACIRGLIDTDGCFTLHKYKVNGKEYCYPKICFSNRSEPLLGFVYNELKGLGLNPKRTFKYGVWLHNQNEVKRYLQVIGTRNYKPAIKKILGGVA